MRKKIIISAISLGIVLILTVLFLLIPWKSNIDVELIAPPREVTQVPLPQPMPSTIAVKLDLPLFEVSEFVESTIQNYVHKPINWKRGDWERATINISPGAPEVISTQDGTVSVKIPLQINGKGVFETHTIFGPRGGDIKGSATASLTFTPRLHSNWHLTTETDVDIRVHEASVTISFTLFDSTTTSITEIFRQEVNKTILPKLKETIAKYNIDIDLKPHAAGVWRKLHEPIFFRREPRIVLSLKPMEILVQKLSNEDETLSLKIGIKTFIQVNGGDVSTDSSSPTEQGSDLPNIRFVDSLKPGYHINAPVHVTYAALENLVRPQVEKAHNLKSIVFENLTLYGSGTQLAAGVGFRMPFLGTTGQLYLLGTPTSDSTAMSFAITELDYSFTTQSLLLKIVENRGEGIFSDLQATVEDKLSLRINTLQEKLSDSMASHKLGSYAVLQGIGTVDTVTIGDPSFTETAMFIPLRLQGDLNYKVHLNPTGFQ